jgi:predicted RNase H-like nuclease (RuvC/YqgF family)
MSAGGAVPSRDEQYQKNEKLRRQLDKAEGELEMIDAALARRPALERHKTRFDKVSYACDTCSKLERELTQARWEIDRLKKRLRDAGLAP